MNKKELESMINKMRKNKFVKEKELKNMLGLSKEEQIYVAERLTRTHKQQILDYLRCPPTEPTHVEFLISRRESVFENSMDEDGLCQDIDHFCDTIIEDSLRIPQDVKNMAKPPWIDPVLKVHAKHKAHTTTLQKITSTKFLTPILPKKRIRGISSDHISGEYLFLEQIDRMMFCFGDTGSASSDSREFLHKHIHSWLKIISDVQLPNMEIYLHKLFPVLCHKYMRRPKTLGQFKLILDKVDIKINEVEEDFNFEEDNQLFDPNFHQDELGIEPETEKIGRNVNLDFLSSQTNRAETEELNAKRTDLMSEEDYLRFTTTRQASFLAKGAASFVAWLGKSKELGVQEKHVIELLAYIGKENIKVIIEMAIRNQHPAKRLFVIESPLELNQIEPICRKQIDLISSIKPKVVKEIQSFEQFCKDERRKDKLNCNRKRGNINVVIEKNTKIQIIIKKSATKEVSKKERKICIERLQDKWKNLDPYIKEWYPQRLQAEEKIKEFCKRDMGEYAEFMASSTNKYEEFLIHHILKKGIKLIKRDIFYDLWALWTLHKSIRINKISL